MVKFRKEQPLSDDGSVDLELWLCKLSEKNPGLNLARIREVCELSEQAEQKARAANAGTSESPSSYRTGLEMADTLSELRVDEDGLIAAIIYRAVRENHITLNHVRKQFGTEVADLVEGVLKMAAISNIRFGDRTPVLGESSDQLEQARRMLVALVDDVRVALIKLAERTSAIRAIAGSTPERKQRLAREVSEIYAPLAHRLGIGHLKWELEDLSLRYLEPLAYRQIAKQLDETRSARQEYIDKVIEELQKKLRLVNIKAKLEGRAKHIYSIWRKMRRKGIPFDEVYDVRAIRLLVDEVDDCYRALGVVHNLWRNIPHEFDDYIANPKENGYKSLHTAVIGPEGKVLEVQIRTQDMHEEAEFGVCSHWQYKVPGAKTDSRSYEERVEWLRQILEWQDELEDTPGLARDILSDVSLDRVYMFTPEGHVIDMNPGATPVDFAYRVHTEIGHKCRGAKVNGRVVPLNTTLHSGDQVEIIVGDVAEPRREWLHEHLGYVTTSRARAKIQAWFGHREKQKNIDEGKRILVNELSHLGIEQLDFVELIDHLEFESTNDLFYAIALGKVDVVDVVETAAVMTDMDVKDTQLDLEWKDQHPEEPLISGLGGLDYTIAECCKPVPGDSIVGVIDDEDVVHIHLQDCLQALKADVYGRIMRLDWKEEVNATFPVNIEVLAYDRSGLLYDITGIFMQESTNVLSIQTLPGKSTSQVILKMKIEVSRLTGLLHTLEKIEKLPNVINARRELS